LDVFLTFGCVSFFFGLLCPSLSSASNSAAADARSPREKKSAGAGGAARAERGERGPPPGASSREPPKAEKSLSAFLVPGRSSQRSSSSLLCALSSAFCFGGSATPRCQRSPPPVLRVLAGYASRGGYASESFPNESVRSCLPGRLPYFSPASPNVSSSRLRPGGREEPPPRPPLVLQGSSSLSLPDLKKPPFSKPALSELLFEYCASERSERERAKRAGRKEG
jgi:hypothetical protein